VRRIAIFAHFDAQHEVKRFVYQHLQSLRLVCESILFVSNSPLAPADVTKLEQLCAGVLVRENTGYDFSMWQHGLAKVALTDWDELVLTNSSVFGPIFPLQGVFSRMQDSDSDFWGMTENTEFARHLQSYFLVFRRRLLAAPAFVAFWGGVLPYRDKYQTIRSYEIGLTTYFREQGFRAASFIPPGSFSRRWPRRKVYDLTLSCPLELLKAKMPYLKAALLRDNPKGVNLAALYSAADEAGYDRSLIQFDRARGTFHVGEA
jgi:rhamnosyltransferase